MQSKDRLHEKRQSFKQPRTFGKGQALGQRIQSPKLHPRLIGESNKTDILISEIPTTALIDTGSNVSTLSKSFYDNYLQDKPIQPIEEFINIECADGNCLSYLGYIETEIQPLGIPNSQPQPCLLLIVPESNYSRAVPVLLGTNIIRTFLENTQQQNGQKFLQETALKTPWYLAFRSIHLRERELSKKNFRLAIVKSAEQNIILIPPNSQVTIQGYTDRKSPYQTTCALLQTTKDSRIPSDLDIEPTIAIYDYKERQEIPVHISNLTTRTVTVNPRAVICELHPVTIVDDPHQLQQEDI